MAQTRNIAQLGEPVLRQTAYLIPPDQLLHSSALQADMHLTLETAGGVGLAAPQVFESVRLIIVASRPTPRYPYAPEMPATVMLNPSFTPLSNDMESGWEGCLSIPGIRARVPRFQHIGVAYTDTRGVLQQTEFHGFVARVFQHEYDHLDGTVYLDRVENNRDIISESVFLQLPLS